MKNEVHFPYNGITPLTLPLPGDLTTTLASLKDVKNTIRKTSQKYNFKIQNVF